MTTEPRKPGHCTCGLKLIERADMLVCPVSPAWPKATRTTHCTFANPPRTSDSPWGRVQHTDTLADGVDVVVTASHGGLRLSVEVQDRLPAHLLMGFMHGPGWAEEDCEAPIVLSLLDLCDERVKMTALAMAMKIERYRAAVPLLEDATGFMAVGLYGGKMDPATKDCPRCGTSIYPALHHVCADRVAPGDRCPGCDSNPCHCNPRTGAS